MTESEQQVNVSIVEIDVDASVEKIGSRQEKLRELIALAVTTNSLLIQKGYSITDILKGSSKVALERVHEENSVELMVGMLQMALIVLTEKFHAERDRGRG